GRIPSGRRHEVKYVGLDWAYRTAQWCALDPGGEIAGEGRFAADRDGLARLVLELGDEVTACLEMMSGALWVRDELVACGWQVQVADARKVKRVAPLDAELRPFAPADPRAVLLDTIPGCRRAARPDDRGRDRRDQPLRRPGEARLRRSARATCPPIR